MNLNYLGIRKHSQITSEDGTLTSDIYGSEVGEADSRRDNIERSADYPVYEVVKTTEQQVKLTPDELENLPLASNGEKWAILIFFLLF